MFTSTVSTPFNAALITYLRQELENVRQFNPEMIKRNGNTFSLMLDGAAVWTIHCEDTPVGIVVHSKSPKQFAIRKGLSFNVKQSRFQIG